MAEAAPAATDLPPVKFDDFAADREQFAEGVVKATTIAVSGMIILLVLMAIFLV
jgi:hypothetical protein